MCDGIMDGDTGETVDEGDRRDGESDGEREGVSLSVELTLCERDNATLMRSKASLTSDAIIATRR